METLQCFTICVAIRMPDDSSTPDGRRGEMHLRIVEEGAPTQHSICCAFSREMLENSIFPWPELRYWILSHNLDRLLRSYFGLPEESED